MLADHGTQTFLNLEWPFLGKEDSIFGGRILCNKVGQSEMYQLHYAGFAVLHFDQPVLWRR